MLAPKTNSEPPRRGTGRCRRRGRLGPRAPAFGGAGFGRLGEWRPPGPSRLFFVPFDLTLVFTGAGLPDFVLHSCVFFSVIAYPVLFIAICLSSRDVSCLFAVLRDFFHNISLGIPSGWELALPRPLLFFVFTGFYR